VPRYYGITPATLVIVLAAIALGAGAFLFAAGNWPVGLILTGVALLLVLLAVEAARRRGDPAAVGQFRERAAGAADSLATRGRAAGRVLSLRRELQRLTATRSRLLFDLGEAVYRGDEQATQTARVQLEELDEVARKREAEMQAVVTEAQARIARRRLEVQPTEMVEIPDPSPGSPGPVRIPEPYPPPDEGNPPQPAIIPEPGPLPEPEPDEPEGARRR
jgi:hypothetical protein